MRHYSTLSQKSSGLLWGGLLDVVSPPVYFLRPSSRVRDFCLLSLSSHFLPSCLLRTSKGLSWLSVSSWWKPPSSHYCLMCAKRPAHKRPAGGPNFHFSHAAQRDSIKNKQGKRALGGVRQRVFAARHQQKGGRSAACVCSTSPLIIESGSLSVALSPEETAGGVAGIVTSTVYTTMAI